MGGDASGFHHSEAWRRADSVCCRDLHWTGSGDARQARPPNRNRFATLISNRKTQPEEIGHVQQRGLSRSRQQGHSHSHPHVPEAHTHIQPRNHDSGLDRTSQDRTSRRDFFRVLMGGALAGASVLELAYHRAAWARAAAPTDDANLFDIQKAAEGVYFAHARPQTIINCNAAIFVRSKDVVVVDAHSKPSAAASIIRQIRREVTDKPVRYVINTHFHWDHTQGDHAYAMTGSKVDFIASSMTKHLMEEFAVARMKASRDAVPAQIEAMRERAEKAASAAEKAYYAEQIRQMEAYQADIKDYHLELPTITFDKSYLLADPAFDLHLGFHGRSHTAGDVFVFCPQQRAIATGDAIHGLLPNIADGYPRLWPGTIDEVARADFKYTMGGHGPMQADRTVMMCQRNYIEELVEKVEAGKKAGQSLAEMQARLTVASLKSMQSNGYQTFLERSQGRAIRLLTRCPRSKRCEREYQRRLQESRPGLRSIQEIGRGLWRTHSGRAPVDGDVRSNFRLVTGCFEEARNNAGSSRECSGPGAQVSVVSRPDRAQARCLSRCGPRVCTRL